MDSRQPSNCHHQVLVSHLVGGAGLIALRLAEHTRSNSQKSQVWIPGRGPAYDEALRRSLPAQDFDRNGLFSRSRFMAATSNWRLGRRMRGFGSGIAHVHSPYFFRAMRLALRWAGLHSVVHVHGEENESGLRWTFQKPPDVIITCARFLVGYVRRTLPDRYRDQQIIVAVPNAVDTERFNPGDKAAAKQRVGAPNDTPMALLLANLSPLKGQETAIRAAAQLKSRCVNVVFFLAGTEREPGAMFTNHLRALIQKLNVADRVFLLGQRDDAPELLRAADYFLLPSATEGLPLSLLEAQASKVPVLANATGGVPEVVQDGATGFLIPHTDSAGYAARIESLTADHDLRERVADAAFAQVTRDHNWPTYASRVSDVYRELSRPDASRANRSRRFAEMFG